LDFKVIETVGMTFGNDKILTSKNFRPSFVLSLSLNTVIVSISVKDIEDSIKRIANSGENKEKTEFMR
jgi:hypothetical protein